MPSESELAQRLARLRFLGMTQAKTGHPDGRLNAGTNQTWIQTDNERAPTAVYGTVGARNVPVWTREMPDGSRVLDKPDYIIGGVTYGGALETVSQPQLQPVDRGNPVVIPSQNMDAGRVIPSPDGSLYVRITPYHYPGGYWNGFENILVEPPAGTLNHRIALVGLDYQTAGGTAVGVVSYGQTYATPVPLTHEEAARMAIGTQSVDWRGWLGLTGGQGSVMGSLVYDTRWFSPGVFQGTDGTLTSYAGLVPAATIADATKFLRADGAWTTVGGGGDAADVTYTPAVAADWNSSADPGDVDNALDQLAERVKDIEGGSVVGYTIGARAYSNTNLTISDSTVTALALNAERYDTDGIHDNSTNNTRLTCQTTGVYMITGTVGWDSNTSGERSAIIRLNGTTFIARQKVTAGTASLVQNVTTIYSLTATDYVELVVYQTSGGNRTVTGNDNESAEFAMQRIG